MVGGSYRPEGRSVKHLDVGTDRAQGCRAVQGRITERHLPLAEQSFPGIGRFYRGLSNKPATFLQLVWMFEASRVDRAPAAKPARRRRA
jgi:hypothetical protein